MSLHSSFHHEHPQYITNLIVGLELSRWTIMIIINIVFLILAVCWTPWPSW